MKPELVRATILLAHGSRDPSWQQPVEAVARRIQSLDPAMLVRCAYLELTGPDLASCAAELASLGTSQLSVFPLFLGLGKHSREDLPRLMQALQAAHPNIEFHFNTVMGENEQVTELLAQIALSR